MCKMEELTDLTVNHRTLIQENALQMHLHEEHGDFPPEQNGSLLAVAQELAQMGDELTERYSRIRNETNQATLWDNVKHHAFVVALRVIFGLV